ncbi:hypothetical protein [Arachidicoccus terrestris]|uniref:hypothetical protein n=1 Tax=Arachidicoccus terrestris TaxID=2875539 RepID=UPI001CC3E2F8|nr:hypothetical protein [Arachidicoccus terrestris]UAY55395.1 hypothetical protein K9M52_18640 [Arachidicoccus terrestris]
MASFIRNTALMLALVIIIHGCRKESPLRPSAEGTDYFYNLPQGNHPFDAAIVDFYNEYKSFILYKYDSVDYNYDIIGKVENGLTLRLADTTAISLALGFMHTNLLEPYPAAFLQMTMPFKILLASSITIQAVSGPDNNMQPGTYHYSSFAGKNYLAFGLVNDSLKHLTGVQLDSARGWLNMAYWQQAIGSGIVSIPPGFSQLTDYNKMGAFGNDNPNKNQYGVFFTTESHGRYDWVTDLLAYICVITSTDSATMHHSWLSASYDVNGLYNEKYNLVTDFYKKTYGIDLQAIGDLKNK